MITNLGKIFYCPIRSNRLVDDTNGVDKYKNVSELTWSKQELEQGKLIKIKKAPADFKVKLFKVVSKKNIEDIEFVVTNDISQNSTNGTKAQTVIRWKIEQFHREIKQNTGIEACQCRKRRSQRNHIACSLLVWVFLKEKAYSLFQNVYQLKQAPLKEYLKQQMLNPHILYS